MPTTRRTARYALVAASLLFVSGCSAAGDPGADPNGSSSASAPSSAAPTTPSPDPKTPEAATSTSPARNIAAPKMPAAARKLSEAGFEAFVDYWFETYNYALATGDTAPLEAVSHKKCGICDHRVQVVDRIHQKGGWAVGGDLSTKSFYTVLEKNDQGMHTAGAKVRQEAATFYGPKGASSDIDPLTSGTAPFNIMAYYEPDTGWKMAIMMVPETDAGAG